MSYFDPKIYNLENLKEKDRKELEFWCDTCIDIVYKTNLFIGEEDKSNTLDKIRHEVVDEFCNDLFDEIASKFHNITVSTIDNYPEEDIPEVENPTTFYEYVENIVINTEEGEDVD